MADNTILNAGSGGDTIRTLAKTANAGAKTQVSALDVGGGDASGETLLTLGQSTKSASLPVTIASDQGSLAVTGTFWQTTQPVSLAALPALATGSNVIGGVTQSGTWNVGVTGSVAVTGSFYPATQPVSAASLPLPSGAATDTTASKSATLTLTNATPQVIAVGAASASSTAMQAGTGRVVLTATTDCWVALGSAPTAAAHTAGNLFLASGVPSYPIEVTGGTTVVAVIEDSAAGYLSILEAA